nr:hypothetical protein [Tanacetum cinerariifolium]
MGELTFFLGLQVKQKQDGIFISQDKYVAKILRKFGLTNGKSASTPIDTKKPLLKDPDGEDMDVHTYRSMIGSLMYLTSSRPDIMFATVVATSSTETEYVAVASCCAQVLWIQNQLLDYGLVRNVDSPSKFYMYPRFLQIMINTQIADLSSHNTKYTSPALTQKVFSNIRRVGKGFSEVDTPLFDRMLVPQQAQEVEDAAEYEDDVNEGRLEESQANVYHLDLEHADKVLSMQETDEAEPVEYCCYYYYCSYYITAALVPKASAPRRRRDVIIQDPEEAATALVIDKAFARELEDELNANINWNDVIDQVKRKERQDNTVMRYQALKRKLVTEAHARKNMMMIMLVERKYPLTRFNLEQMLNNVRLEVEEKCKMSLELLRLYKVSDVQIVSAASIAVNTVSSKNLHRVDGDEFMRFKMYHGLLCIIILFRWYCYVMVATLRALVHAGDKSSGDTRMTTQSAGQPAAASRGGGTTGRAGRDGGRTKGRSSDQGDDRINGQGGQVGGQGSEIMPHRMTTRSAGQPAAASRGGGTTGRAGGQGSEVNDGVNGVLDFSTIIAQELQNLLPTIVAQVDDQGRGQRNESCNRLGYFAKDCRVVSLSWAESGLEARGNHKNEVVAVNGGQGRGSQGNQARGRAFMLGVEEARQDPNIMTDIEPSDLGFSYDIEITNGQLVEIDKMRQLISARTKEKTYPDCHLFGKPSLRELVPGAMSVAKSPYRVTPSELEELSGQLKEL